MARFRMAALVAVGIIAHIESASSADLSLRRSHSREQVTLRGSFTDLPLRPTRLREQVSHRGYSRNTIRPEKELLFREFLDWLKKR